MTKGNPTDLRRVRIDDDGAACLVLDGEPCTLEEFDCVLGRRTRLEIADTLWEKIQRSADRVDRIARGTEPAYGINTGFGRLCTKRISPDKVTELQHNLIVSHAVGVGDPVPPELVRWMMIFKIVSLTRGMSGVSRSTVECLTRLLEADILPVIPTQGSLGASGDLAPLAHMVLPMIGMGSVRWDGRTMPAAEALGRAGISACRLGPKDGLALINGTQLMAAYAAAMVVRSRRLIRQADVIGTMSLEALKGSALPFARRLQDLRPHPGALETADNVTRMMVGSQILESHAHCDRVQDPYSLRCIPQVHGASRDAIRHAAGVVETEINSVTDNPIVFDDGEVISGGLFHGQPLALVLDYLAIALAELASISERRIYQLISGAEDLPVFLLSETGVNSGLMIPQYTAAALVSENKGLCTPASVDSIPTSLGQEDHVSMGARAATKGWQVLLNCETVLAIEQMCAAQALDFRAPLQPGVGPRTALEEVRKEITHAEADRLFGEDIQTSLALLRSQRVVKAVEEEVGALQ